MTMQAQDQTAKTVAPPPQMAHRYDGIAKVTGTAKYCAEFREPFDRKQLAYAYLVQSTIPNGTIQAIDASMAEHAPGVLAVITPFNAPKLVAGPPKPPAKRKLSLLQDTDVHYNGEPIAVVVATSLDRARAAAAMVKIRYNAKPAMLGLKKHLAEAHLPGNPGKEPAVADKGKFDAAMAKATVVVDNTYITPIQNHNPMEPHATIAWWEGDHLHVYDSTQYITGDLMSLAKTMSLPMEFVHVTCPYVGGGFGSKGSMWSHVPLAAMAAKVTDRPVQLALDRVQMFGPVGARPCTINHIRLGATADGKLQAISQDVVMNSSVMETFVEHSETPAKMLYAHEAGMTSNKIVELNLGVSTFMRAPGEAPGTAVFEIAMDELAEKLNMDPLQLRLVNYAEKDPSKGLPWTSKHLREAYAQASERFGWSKRPAKPGTVIENNQWVGYGMATATYPANRSEASATVRALPNGRFWVGSGTQDLGTGTYTIMAQTVAQSLKIDPTLVDVSLGDSSLPKAPVSGGSQSAASVTPAIADACTQLSLALVQTAINDLRSPLHGKDALEVAVANGALSLKQDRSVSDRIVDVIERAGGKPISATGSAEPGEDKSSSSAQSFGAVFAEVAVDRSTYMVEVRRVVATYDIGVLINERTGINQLQGGIVWSVGFALTEDTVIDPNVGRTVNENLADYHVPTNPDIGVLDVTVLGIPDTKFNPLGNRGIGEIGNTGAAAAIANAIYNATGKRVREYPITPDKILRA